MKIILKKIHIALLLFVIVFTSNSFALPNLNQLRERIDDFDNTYMFFNKSPELICDGELVVLGDSYGFLFCEYIDEGVNYIVHQGYDLNKIWIEFLPHIKKDTYKYAFLMIGPNDFLEQTQIIYFKTYLQLIIMDLKAKGMQVIVTDYCDPNYNSTKGAILAYHGIQCWQYDYALKELAVANGLIFIEMKDLLKEYGWLPDDIVHPDKRLYGPLLERVEKAIINDKAGKEEDNLP